MPCELYAWLKYERGIDHDDAEPIISHWFEYHSSEDPRVFGWWYQQEYEAEQLRLRRSEAARKGWETRRLRQRQEALVARMREAEEALARRLEEAVEYGRRLVQEAMAPPAYPMLAERSVLPQTLEEHFAPATLSYLDQVAEARWRELEEMRVPSGEPQTLEQEVRAYLERFA